MKYWRRNLHFLLSLMPKLYFMLYFDMISHAQRVWNICAHTFWVSQSVLKKKSENSPTIIGCDTFFLVKKMNVKIKSNQMKDNSCISKKTSIFHHWYFIYVETSVIRNKEVPKCLVKCSSNMFKNETHIVLFSLKNGIKVCCLIQLGSQFYYSKYKAFFAGTFRQA